ncbi:efflux RND transporter permease subunit, partial [Brevirhabdus sp.]|uniref:efflux RND transporter permease subunit n=1 Tax=Brevirhabdus sp. TaxID=2004514 RepID=UPI0040587C88
GIEAATYPDGPRSARIRVELPPGELTADFLDRTQIRTAGGDYVPLADVVQVTRRSGFSTIRRENGLRIVSVTGDIAEDDPARAAAIMEELQSTILPGIESDHGVAYRLSGLSEQENAFLSDAALGFLLCIVGIYLTLAWVFSSWTRPIIVMAIIPFGLIGTIYGHWAWDVPLSMFTVVGLIGMTGIIINDSIVLVTTIDEYAAQRGLIPAIVEGASERLRPVLLTTLTTVLGLAPLLYESSQQAQFLKPTVITLCYGLGFGVVLVLLLVPALMAMQHDIKRQTTALRRALRRPRRTGGSGALSVISVGLTFVWFAATMGWFIARARLPVPVSDAVAALLPRAAAERLGESAGGVLVLFVLGTGALLLLLYVLGALALGGGRARARRRSHG